MRRFLHFTGQAIAVVVVIVGGIALLVGVVVPRLTGATPYTVLTDSMRPTLPPGTVVVTRPSSQVALGDVITFQLKSGEPEVVTHRVDKIGFAVDGTPVYHTRGDANPAEDRAEVHPVQIRGVMWYHIPYLGYLTQALTGQQRNYITISFAALLVSYAAWQVTQQVRERGPARPAAHKAMPGLV